MVSLDLHGRNRYEAEVLLDSFLKESYCNKEYFVCIIHGHGEGIITKLVREKLNESEYVKSYEFAPPQYGGSGATIVYINSEL